MGEPREHPTYADVAAVQAQAERWTASQLECRDLGHHWAPRDAVHVRRLGYYRVSHACARCGMVRIRELSERGHVYASTYEYPDGYLAVGLGRIAGDAKDILRVEALRRSASVTEVRGRAKDDDMPRFGATRKAME